MKIVCDENIPQAQQAFAAFGEVRLIDGRQLNREDLLECECLLVRSVTRVNHNLLHRTPVRFVASATIGTDHVDLDYLKAQNIGFSNAPGCNAESAAEYMLMTLFELCKREGKDPWTLRPGIVGYGNVGSRLKAKFDALGIDCLINDPPLQAKGDTRCDYQSLDTLLNHCDLISLHVPLTQSGQWPTEYLFNAHKLASLRPNSWLFNAARGAVVNNAALSSLLQQRDDLLVFLDTWESEPAISQSLLQQVHWGTPHIAGYSIEGKLRGTDMIRKAAADFFGIEESWSMESALPAVKALKMPPSSLPQAEWLRQVFQQVYASEQDYQALFLSAQLSAADAARQFDRLRKHYPKRYEWDRYAFDAGRCSVSRAHWLQALGFQASSVMQ